MTLKGESELVEVMSSHSELNDSCASESVSDSEDDISETSEDRAFVVSDGEQSAYSHRSSVSSRYSRHCHMHCNDSSVFNGQKVPISILSKRIIQQNESSVVQYLVIWRSWEQEKPHISGTIEETRFVLSIGAAHSPRLSISRLYLTC
ncbi:hypothetical protein N7485_004922 [Penicillium canescens]|nr:hypothetical protein N7485_004922 [Penicillium canescens]